MQAILLKIVAIALLSIHSFIGLFFPIAPMTTDPYSYATNNNKVQFCFPVNEPNLPIIDDYELEIAWTTHVVEGTGNVIMTKSRFVKQDTIAGTDDNSNDLYYFEFTALHPGTSKIRFMESSFGFIGGMFNVWEAEVVVSDDRSIEVVSFAFVDIANAYSADIAV